METGILLISTKGNAYGKKKRIRKCICSFVYSLYILPLSRTVHLECGPYSLRLRFHGARRVFCRRFFFCPSCLLTRHTKTSMVNFYNLPYGKPETRQFVKTESHYFSCYCFHVSGQKARGSKAVGCKHAPWKRILSL